MSSTPVKGKKKKEVQTVTLVKHASFYLAHEENAVNVTMALAKSGYFVNIIRHSGAWLVEIYKHLNTL